MLTLRDRAIVTTGTGAIDRTMIDPRHRYPGIIAVTIIAGVGRIDVRGIFPGRRTAVVTTGTRASDTAVVKIDIAPTAARVAIVAGIGSGNVRGILANGYRAIVTTSATASYRRMIDSCHRKPGGR